MSSRSLSAAFVLWLLTAACSPPPCEGVQCGLGEVCEVKTGTCIPRPGNPGPGPHGGDGGTPDAGGGTGPDGGLPDGGVQPQDLPDSCAQAHTLTLHAGSDRVREGYALDLAGDDYPAACDGEAEGPELVLRLVLTSAVHLKVKATAVAQAPFLSLFQGSCEQGLPLVCGDTSGHGNTLEEARLEAGEYFLRLSLPADATDRQVALEVETSQASLDASCGKEGWLSFGSGDEVRFTTALAQAGDDEQGLCNASRNAPERLYGLKLASEVDLEVTARPLGWPPVDVVLYLREGSCNLAPGEELRCSQDHEDVQATERLKVVGARPGTWYLVVEAAEPLAGEVEVVVRRSPSTRPANDTCEAPLTLLANGATSTAFSVDTSLAGDDAEGSCGNLRPSPGGNGELVYHLQLASPADVRIEARAAHGESLADPVVFVRQGACEKGTELACADEVGDAEAVRLRNLPAGDYYVFLGAFGQGAGPLEVEVELREPTLPPEGDTCAAPRELFADGSLTASWEVDTREAFDDAEGSCGLSTGSPGGELVHHFRLTTTADLRVEASAPPGSGADAVLYLRQGTCGRGVELTCVDALAEGTERLQRAALPPGDYYLFVDEAGTSPGVLALSATLQPSLPPPVNDTCALAADLLAPGATSGSAVVDVRQATDDTRGRCSSDTGGREVVYRLHLDGPQDLEVEVRGEGGDATVDPLVYLRSAPCTGGRELACTDAAPGTPERLFLQNLPAGDYFLFVEEFDTQGGRTEVSVALHPPSVADTCGGGAPLLVSDAEPFAFVQASTVGLTSGEGTACAGVAGSGPDAVWRVEVDTPSSFLASVTPLEGPAGTLQPLLSLRPAGACGSTGALPLACAVGPGADGDALLHVPVLSPGSYELVVAGVAGSSGIFELAAQLGPEALAPGNDDCTGAEPLLLDGSGFAVSVGSTQGARDDIVLSCSSTSAGAPDVVYRFHTPAGLGPVSARAVAFSADAVALPAPALALRTRCTGVGAQVCGVPAAGSTQAQVLAEGLAPDTDYFLWVDTAGAPASSGSFVLQLDVAGAPPANDTCAGAAVLPANATVPGLTLGATDSLSSASGHYGGGSCSGSLSGADVVFAYTAGVTGTVRVRLSPDRGVDLALALLGGCVPGACLATADAAGPGGAETLSFSVVAGTPYFLAVDSALPGTGGDAASRGHFTLEVRE